MLHLQFEQQVEKTPGAVALTFGDQTLTYHELNAKANQVAHYLRTLGAGPETLIALVFERGPDAVSAMLGALKSGGAFVALDPSARLERFKDMLDDARPLVALTRGDLQIRLPKMSLPVAYLDDPLVPLSAQSTANPEPTALPDSLACVAYPPSAVGAKGIAVTHRALSNGHDVAGSATDAPPHEVYALSSSLAVGLSASRVLAALASGARVAIIPNEYAADLQRITDQVEAAHATSIDLTPPQVRQLLRLGPGTASRLARLRTIAVDAPALTADVTQACETMLPRVSLVRRYVVPEAGRAVLSSGKPAGHTRVYVLDARLHPVPPDTVGEIYVSVAPQSRGYLRRPGLTADRFVADPFEPGGRLYRTGDLGQLTTTGEIVIHGAADENVKFRGHRIALKEIEDLLKEHGNVRDVAVALQPVGEEDKLVAYIVAEGMGPTVSQLRSYLQDRVPAYMLPSQFVSVDSLPRTGVGKVDRKALPAPEPVRPVGAEAYAEPRNTTEAAIADIWAEVLLLDRVGIYDDFLDLGGDSLIASQVVARIWESLGTEIPIEALFERGTIAAIWEQFFADPLRRQEGV